MIGCRRTQPISSAEFIAGLGPAAWPCIARAQQPALPVIGFLRQDIEQFIPFIKALFDGLRAARDFFRRDRRPEHAIGIPQNTLILLPDVHTHALRWCLGKAGEKEAMQISGSLQGTNTSRYAVRAADIKLLEPTRVAVLTQTITIGDPESGMHSTWHLIPAGHIGEVSFMFL
jgi:hypothetical protein